MKSKKLIFILFFLIFLSGTSLNSKEEFIFEVTEIEILNEGNLFKGLKRGDATSIDGNVTITADTFEYDRTKNILVAKGNVVLKDKIKNYLIESNHITYYKNNEKIFSKDKTRAFFENKYEVFSSDVELDKITNIINTDKKTKIIDDNYTEYETDLFNYSIEENIFKGKNIKITTDTNKNKIEKEFYNFKDGIFDLDNKEFVASDTKIFLKKNSFNKEENDPRIYGSSSKKIKNYLIESDHITYYKNNEKIFSKDKTRAFFENKYEVFSSDVELDKTTNIITTNNKTKIFDDNFNEYETDLLHYSIDKNIFKGKNINIIAHTNKKDIEREFYKFKDGIFDLANKEFIASDTKIYLKDLREEMLLLLMEA